MSDQLLAERFAAWAVELRATEIPQEVIHSARRAMFDTIGVTAAGSAHAKVKDLADNFLDHGQSGSVAAATINGMAAHVWDFDDTSYTGVIHGSAIILPAVLAVAAEIEAAQSDIMVSFVIGSEIAYTLGEICTHRHFLDGWWATGSCGLVGATAAVCRLYGLTVDQTASALGTAAVSAGIERAIAGTDAKPYLVGHVAGRAITLAQAAKAGLTGPHDAFEQDNGFFALLNGRQSTSIHSQSLGHRWRLHSPGLLFKIHPVCSGAHAAIELTAKLLRDARKSANDIAAIRLEVPQMVYAGLTYARPDTPQQAQFSLPYCIACAAQHGRVRLEDLEDCELSSRPKRELMERVTTHLAEDLSSPQMREKYPESARITLSFSNNETVTGFCGDAYGMPNRPLSDGDMVAKFNDCAAFAGRELRVTDLRDCNLVDLAQQLFAQPATLKFS